jgi:hypothetical protein
MTYIHMPEATGSVYCTTGPEANPLPAGNSALKQFRTRETGHKKIRRNLAVPAEIGGAEGTRTPDPLHAMQVRYQLRHSPEFLLLLPENLAT